VKANKLSLPLF